MAVKISLRLSFMFPMSVLYFQFNVIKSLFVEGG